MKHNEEDNVGIPDIVLFFMSGFQTAFVGSVGELTLISASVVPMWENNVYICINISVRQI